MEHVYLATPTGTGQVSVATMNTVVNAYLEGFQISRNPDQSRSLLCQNFNRLLVDAYNMLETHGLEWFVMLHSDIGSLDANWLSILLSEADSYGFDVISAAVPIKDYSRALSMALYDTRTDVMVRLDTDTLREWPDTFSNDDVYRDTGKVLCINTGMMAIRISNIPNPVTFRTVETIKRDENGVYKSSCLSEDWGLSIELSKSRIPYGVTQKIRVVHFGNNGWAYGGDIR